MTLTPFDLTVHIGSGKTGTTSVQRFLAENRASLLDRGWLFPRSPGASRHVRFGMMAMPDDELRDYRAWKRTGETDPGRFRRRVRRRLSDEIAASGAANVLVSDEALFGSSPGRIRNVRAFARERARSVRIVAYVRRQDDHLLSRYQQVVKLGSTARLTQWYAANGARMYDYHAVLARWQDLSGASALIVRPFERVRFHEGSLYQDFLDAAAIPARVDELATPSDRNESLSAEGVEMLRLLNLYRVKEQGAQTWQLDNAPLVRALAAQPGPTLGLPRAELDSFMSRWEDTNRRVATEFLHTDAPLFTAPSRTDRVVEQRLEPARVDHYLPLLEVPEQDWAGIRRTAEREASRG